MNTPGEKSETISKGIRFPVGLADQVERIARSQRRAFSQQVIYMVEEYLKAEGYTHKPAEDQILNQLSS